MHTRFNETRCGGSVRRVTGLAPSPALHRLLFITLLSFFGGCAHNSLEAKFSYYGTFCGPGKPETNQKSDVETQLDNISALDDLDWACKQHDMCYVRLGHSSRVCDELLSYILDHWALPPGCNNIGYDVKAYFYRLHPSRNFLGNVLSPVFNMAPKLLIDHTMNLSAPSGLSPDVVSHQCCFGSHQRRSYLEIGRKFGGPFEWGRPLPKSLREAERKYATSVSARHADSAAYDAGLIYLLGLDGVRNERSAYEWFGRCSRNIRCREKKEMLEYKWERIGEDREEVLRGVSAGCPVTKSRERLAEPREEDITKSRVGLAEKNLAAGKAFMAANRKKEGVSELPNGLQYRVIKAGSGPKPKLSDTVSVHYRGILIDGREFDSSDRAGKPVSFRLNSVIKGWREALPLMPEGSKWQVVIPPELAYGAQWVGAAIGPNETLVFDIELVGIGAAKDK